MNYPSYPKYKKSEYPLIDSIPYDWELTRIDFKISKRKSQLNADKMNGEEIIHYSIPNVQEFGNGILESGTEIDSSKLLIEERQLLVSKLNPRKKTICIADRDKEYQTVASSEFVQFIPESENLVLNYLYYFYLSDTVVQFLSSIVQSVTKSHQRANPDDIRKIFWYLPSPEEQQTIASFLDYKTEQIDDLITKKEELLKLLEEKRIALITQAVTKGLDPNVKMKPSGIDWLGDIPEHWQLKALKRIVSTPVTDGPHETPELFDDGIPFISAEAVRNDQIDFDRKRGFISIEDHHRFSKKYIPQRDDIYVIKSGATTGNIAMVETDIEFNIWSPLAAIRVDRSQALAKFIFYFLKSECFRTSIILGWSFGTQQNIGMNVIENLMVAVPPKSEQEEIVSLLNTELGKLNLLSVSIKDAIEKLKEYRTSLITSAVTGKIDVRDFKPPREE